MKRIDDHQTGCFWDEWGHLGPKRRRLLEQDWPGVFRQYLFEELPVEELAQRFHHSHGRPSKELFAITGALVLQVLFDHTDAEAVNAFCFDLRWHYALNIRGESDQDKYVCVRSLKGYRSQLIALGLEELLFTQLTSQLIRAFGVDPTQQRLDSSHLKSAMRNLSRLQLFVEVIHKFLVQLKKKHPQQYEDLERPLRDAYEKGSDSGCFAMKPSESGKKLVEVAQDLYRLVQRFEQDAKVSEMRTYGHLCRVLREQCEVEQGGPQPSRVQVKAPGEVGGDSLQNPSDEQATYDKHKGKGYQVQVMETYQPVEPENKDRGVPDLITHVKVEKACRSDVHALSEAIEESESRGCKPERVLADGAYGSYENWQKAEAQGVELVAPGNKGSEDWENRLGYSQFTYETDGRIQSCPAGKAPVRTGRTPKGAYQTWFDRQSCLECPLRDKCLVTIGKKKARLPSYTAKRAFLSAHRAYEESEEFRQRYRWRAGIEATFSRLKRQFGANRLRVRGMRAMKYNVTLKALAMNIHRCAQAQKARFEGLGSSYSALISTLLAKLGFNKRCWAA